MFPPSGRHDQATGTRVEPRAPPTERTVGHDMVAAQRHEAHVLPAVGTAVPVDDGETRREVGATPVGVVGEDNRPERFSGQPSGIFCQPSRKPPSAHSKFPTRQPFVKREQAAHPHAAPAGTSAGAQFRSHSDGVAPVSPKPRAARTASMLRRRPSNLARLTALPRKRRR